MRILEVITSIQKAAGTSVFVCEVANEMVRRGHDVTIALSASCIGLEHCELVSSVKIVSIESVLALGQGDATKDIFDVVHLHTTWNWIHHRASAWAVRHHIPIVRSAHGSLAPWALRLKWWKKCLPWCLYQKRDFKKADVLHATVPIEAQWYRDAGLMQRVCVVPLGTDIDCEIQETGECVSKTILFVGRLHPVKALDRLIAAFMRIDAGVWKLRIVGPDDYGYLKQLKKLCFPMSRCETNIEFVGPRYGDDLSREYAECDFLVLPSHTENFGGVVVNALAHGKPVIASRKTPWSELESDRCGYWVENDVESLSAALTKMMSLSNEERKEMGRRGRKLVERRYTWSAVGSSMENVYRDLKRKRG